MKLLSTLLLFALVIAALLWIRSESKTAPDVILNFTDGTRKTLADYRGQPTLITFWSINCPICIKDIPQLTQLHDGGLTVLAISIPQDPPNVVLSFLDKRPIPYPTALDVHGEVSRGFGGVQATPTHFLLDPDGMIALRMQGAIDITRIKATETTFQTR